VIEAEDPVAVLQRTALFAPLGGEALEGLARAARGRRLGVGEVLFARGDPPDGLVVVVRGQLKVVLRSRDGAELLLSVLHSGDTLGEPSVADGGSRSATVIALEPTTLLLVGRTEVLALALAHPEVADRLMTNLAGLVRRLTDECSDLVFLDLRRRVAKLLLGQVVAGRVVLELNQSGLASMLGASRQAVNGALRGLEQRGWIARDRRTVVLEDEAALRRFVDS
jgi:CRP/FNR family cyclic AMP-dependent transcriptional regulator